MRPVKRIAGSYFLFAACLRMCYLTERFRYITSREVLAMGKGDKRSRRGKIFKGSYGNSRPQKTATAAKKPSPSGVATKKPAPAKKSK